MKKGVQRAATPSFSSYQVFVIAVLALLQFTIVLDFMVLSPLGAILMDELAISTSDFGWIVSAYAFSAGASGIAAAGFADKFDRKKLLLFFYSGFMIGTALCATADSFRTLLLARVITGLFGGVMGSVSFAIIADLFVLEARGRVMGFVQMAFAVSQVLGIPIGLSLANHWGWHFAFWMIVIIGLVPGLAILLYLKPVTAHLTLKQEHSPFRHLIRTISNGTYLTGFTGTMLLAVGGFMMMPFGSTFTTRNLGISLEQLPLLYFITGLFSLVSGPVLGKLSDRFDKYLVFCAGSVVSMLMVAIYTHLGTTPFSVLVVINVVMFTGIMSRMIAASALTSAVPDPPDRGAYMSVSSSVQQVAGGIAAAIGGMIIVEREDHSLQHYDIVGYITIVTMVIAMGLLYFVDRYIKGRKAAVSPAGTQPAPVEE